MILSSWPDHFTSCIHPQNVCFTSAQWFCQVDLTIFQSLSILSMYVMFLNDPIKLTWLYPNLWPCSASMWCFSMILSSWPDQFLSLSICRKYVMLLNYDPANLTCAFHNYHPSSACMWWFSMILSSWWPNHLLISVYPQNVCDDSQWSCQVDLIIFQSLSIPRK